MQLGYAEFSAGFCLFSSDHLYSVFMLFVVGVCFRSTQFRVKKLTVLLSATVYGIGVAWLITLWMGWGWGVREQNRPCVLGTQILLFYIP